MKIGLHAPAIDDRGNGTVLYDYAHALKYICGYDPIIISDKNTSIHVENRFSEFKCYLYNNIVNEVPYIIDKEKIEVLYMSRYGYNEGIPLNCKTAIHCVFTMSDPHGNVYAGVSEWLAKQFGSNVWVPHIINLPKTSENLREKLGIPGDAFVIGRHGGGDQFNIPFVHSAIFRALETRKDLWGVFLNTIPFTNHPRVKFLPFNPDISYKSKFINTCDAMIHARLMGETFGLSVGEFSSFNKPVFTWDGDGQYARAHIDMLGEKALLYKNEDEVLAYLLQIDKEYVDGVEWDCYSKRFSPENVIKQFKEVFIG
jgi:glycosyltransferase involved in cell wall biosynthesis